MDQREYVKGLICGGGAYLCWGLLPLYWWLVRALDPVQIFAHRVVWSFLFLAVLLRSRGQLTRFFGLLRERRYWASGLGCTVFISINWLTYIWAVNNGYVVESSLGYFMNPLVMTLLGVVFFGERLTKLQIGGMLFAVGGVALSTWFYHRIPVVALVLAVSFAIYGAFKKKSGLDSLNGLALETLLIGVPALPFVLGAEIQGTGIHGNLPVWFWGLIALSGIVTAVPLLLYAEGAKRLPLSVVGFLQYISPTIALVLGITVFREPFDGRNLAAFGLIWVGLALFTWSQVRILKQKPI